MRVLSTRFISTRGQAPEVSLSAALAAGLAPDGGLYLAQSWPQFSAADFDGLGGLPAIAERLLQPLFLGDSLADDLPAICREALTIPLPFKTLPLPNSWLLELFHGPTAAFKDFGARFLAACLHRLERGAASPLDRKSVV